MQIDARQMPSRFHTITQVIAISDPEEFGKTVSKAIDKLLLDGCFLVQTDYAAAGNHPNIVYSVIIHAAKEGAHVWGG